MIEILFSYLLNLISDFGRLSDFGFRFNFKPEISAETLKLKNTETESFQSLLYTLVNVTLQSERAFLLGWQSQCLELCNLWRKASRWRSKGKLAKIHSQSENQAKFSINLNWAISKTREVGLLLLFAFLRLWHFLPQNFYLRQTKTK